MIDYIIPGLLVGISALLAVLLPIFLVSGIDDFFIDLYYIGRSLIRAATVRRKHPVLEEEELRRAREKPVAIMVPAWDESAVIGRMLTNTLSSVDYGNYEIFVGIYPNDEATAREIERVQERADNVHVIVCPNPGPTSKADCLNWIYHGIREYEREHDREFDVFVMHDAEDIVHPLSMRLFNYLIPRKGMVQLPVFPLEVPWWHLTAGHYIDDFAENHQKELVAREFLSGEVPSAGTGCAFSRAALRRIEKEGQGELFNTETVTEDYDFGIRLSRLGLKAVFVKQGLLRVRTRRNAAGRLIKSVRRELIATRERFPDRFWEAVRQKSRWTVGIVMQGWRSVGWRGVLRHDYMLFRDRKGVVTAIANVLAYVVVVGFVFVLLWSALGPGYRYPPLVEPGSLLWGMLLVVTFFMVWRALVRMYFVNRVYGWRQALLVPPRLVWGNLINFVAASRAIWIYGRHLVTKEPIAWDATAHSYPQEEELRTYRRLLGDLLLEKQFITEAQLEEALREQAVDGRPVGEILLDSGFVDEDHLVQALGIQFNVSTAEIDPYETPVEVLRRLPRSLAIRYSVYPLETQDGGALAVASSRILSREEVDTLEEAVDARIDVVLSARSDLAFAIQRGYGRLERDGAGRGLGARLLEAGRITREQLDRALKRQRRSYVRLGDLLVGSGGIEREALGRAVDRHQAEAPEQPFGEFLVQRGLITREALEEALDAQRDGFQRLGDILVSMDAVEREVVEANDAEAAAGDRRELEVTE